MDGTDNRVLTEKQLADYLGVSYWTVREWRLQEDDPLPTVGTGRILYRLKTVFAWMDRSEQRNAQHGRRRKHKKRESV